MKYSINAHSSIRIELDSKVIYFDPFSINKEIHDADIIFITHDHYDHFSIEDVKKVAKTNTFFVLPKTCLKKVLESGVNEKAILALSPYEEIKYAFGFGFNIIAVPAYNEQKKFHPKENSWLGYIIEAFGKKIYVTGDSDINSKNIPLDSPIRNLDYIFIPVGGTYTYSTEEASAFVNAIKPKFAIPTHYGSIVGDKGDGKAFKALVHEGIEVELLI